MLMTQMMTYEVPFAVCFPKFFFLWQLSTHIHYMMDACTRNGCGGALLFIASGCIPTGV